MRRPEQHRLIGRLRRAVSSNVTVLICTAFVVVLAALAVGVSLLPLPDPTSQSALVRLKPPSVDHLLGTDRLGRDILSRVLWGARVSLSVGVGVVIVSGGLGTVLGVVSGYSRGWPSEVVLRLTDILLAFPPLILAMVTVTVLGNNLFTVVLAISVGVVPRFARVTRGTILSIREREYVEAARALGASAPRIIWSHVLLNAVDPLIVLCTLLIPGRHRDRGAAEFSRAGHRRAEPDLGQHDPGRPDRAARGALADVLPRRGHRVHGPGLQPARRRDSRRARSVSARRGAGGLGSGRSGHFAALL